MFVFQLPAGVTVYDSLKVLLEKIRKGGPEEKIEAIGAVLNDIDARINPEIAAALKDSNPRVRSAALHALSGRGAVECVPEIERFAKNARERERLLAESTIREIRRMESAGTAGASKPIRTGILPKRVEQEFQLEIGRAQTAEEKKRLQLGMVLHYAFVSETADEIKQMEKEQGRRMGVALSAARLGCDFHIVMAALLHDIGEDATIRGTETAIAEIGELAGPKVAEYVRRLTRNKEEEYELYLQTVYSSENVGIMVVKALDTIDNLKGLYFEGRSEEFRERQIEKALQHVKIWRKLNKHFSGSCLRLSRTTWRRSSKGKSGTRSILSRTMTSTRPSAR